MRRSRAPSGVPAIGVALCLLLWPAAAAPAEQPQPDIEAAAAPAEAAAPTVSQATPAVVREARRGHGFVCQRRTVHVAATGTTFKVAGTLAVKSLTCQDCCQENILFEDDFELGHTGAWSSTVP